MASIAGGRKSRQFLYFVKPGDTLSKIVSDFFRSVGSGAQLAEKIREVAQRSGIANPDRIYPGQVIVLGGEEQRAPASFNVGCPIPREELNQVENTWQKLPPEKQRALESGSDLLADILDWGGNVNGFAGAGFSSAEKVTDVLAQLRPPEPRISLQIETVIRQVQRTILVIREKSITALRKTGVSVTQRAVVQIEVDATAVASYGAQMMRLSKLVPIAKWGGRACVAVDIGLAIAKTASAPCGQRLRTGIAQAASIAVGGFFGGLAAYGACNMILGLPTAGTSIIWCGLIVGGAAGIATGNLAERGASWSYDSVSSRLSGTGSNVMLPPLK